ncbi:MAG: chitinase [Lachnospiraceae bacterium]|nr:chitinase [Lachnospiraceae bacterium]
MKKVIPALVAIVLILVIVAGSIGVKLVEKYSYSKERADLEEYYDLQDENETAIVLQDEILEDKALLLDGTYYFALSTVHQYLNERFYEDSGEGLLLYTTPTDIIRAEIGSAVFTQDGSGQDAGYVISRYVGDTLYVAVDYVKKFTNFSYETFTNPNRMQVYTQWEEQILADVGKDTQIRYQGGIKSDILIDAEAGTQVVVLEEMEKWVKVKAKAVIGYVEKKRLNNIRTERLTAVTDYEEPVYTNISKDYKICMGWHQVTSAAANATLSEATSATEGMNTISPTWFSLSDNEGNFTSIASTEYVAQAHQKGLEVWGLVDNFSDAVDSYSVLSSTTKRAHLIDGLIQAAAACGMDGINIDFEQLTPETGRHFVQFLRELSIPCRANGIVLSVDNYVPIGNTDYYGRRQQGEVVDYVIIMGYDEHWSGSEEAGSVASIDFVETGIERTLEEVPAEKVINGIPFYTRIWKTEGAQVTSDAVGMNSAEQFLANNGVSAQWDDTTCQNYAEFEKDGAVYQVWLEDEQSIQVKLNVMANYGIAGVSAWKLGFERPSVWNVIDGYLHG